MILLLAILQHFSSTANSTEPPYSHAENAFVQVLAKEAIDKAVHVTLSNTKCELPIIKALDFTKLTKKRTEIAVLDREGNKQSLSVLTSAEARQLQSYIASQDHLAFGFTESGCVQRAVEIHRILHTQGIEAGIIQAFDDSFGDGEGMRLDSPPAPAGSVWKFHTAATIGVVEKGIAVVKVLDPSLSPKLLSRAEWLRELQKRSTNDSKILSDYVPLADETTPSREARANLTLRIFGEAQKRREEFLKNRAHK